MQPVSLARRVENHGGRLQELSNCRSIETSQSYDHVFYMVHASNANDW